MKLSRTKRVWLAWATCTFVALIGSMASGVIVFDHQMFVTPIKLEPGERIEIKILRVTGDSLSFMTLWFERPDCPRLKTTTLWDARQRGFPIEPGAAVRMTASVPDQPMISYEALSHGDPCRGILTGNPSARSGLLLASEWPPRGPALHLHPGINQVAIHVLAADDTLVGKPAKLVIRTFPTIPIISPFRPFWLFLVPYVLMGSIEMLLMLWGIWPPIWLGLIIWAIFIVRRSKRSRLM